MSFSQNDVLFYKQLSQEFNKDGLVYQVSHNTVAKWFYSAPHLRQMSAKPERANTEFEIARALYDNGFPVIEPFGVVKLLPPNQLSTLKSPAYISRYFEGIELRKMPMSFREELFPEIEVTRGEIRKFLRLNKYILIDHGSSNNVLIDPKTKEYRLIDFCQDF